MKAVVVTELGAAELRDDVETVPVGSKSVRVKLRAAGICRTDLSASNGVWPTRLPVVLGHEGAGDVVEVGRDVKGISEGDRVIVTNLQGCGRCYFCVRDQPFLCGHHGLRGEETHNFLVAGDPGFGMVGLGTWSEEVVLRATNVVPYAVDVPYEIASLVTCAVMTGVGAVIRTAKIEPGATVAIVGAGGVGSAAIQGARLAGAGLIVAVDPVESKFDRLRAFGATHTIIPEALPDAVRDLTAGVGFDYAFENVGRADSIRSAWDATRVGGTIVWSGIGSESTPAPFSLYELTMGAKTLIGSIGGSVVPLRDYQNYLDLSCSGRLDLAGLITDTISLEQAISAMNALDSGADISRQVIIF